MVSQSHFFDLSQRYQNISPLKKVTEIRMNHAKKMLISGNSNLADIANAIGYSSEFAFAKVFKKHFNISPGKFLSNENSVM
jgi:AraC family transcriptional activator of mtrCDE